MKLSQAIRRTHRWLGGDRDKLDRLADSVGESDDELSLEFGGESASPGTLIEVEGEVMYVWAASNGTLTVERDWDGDGASSHDAGAIVRIAPRFTGLRGALAEELQALPGLGLYRMRVEPVELDRQELGYPLGDLDGLLSVYGVKLIEQTHTRWAMDFIVQGSMLRLQRPERPSAEAEVHYRAPFDALPDDPSASLSETGLPESAHDILPIGAAARLAAGKVGDRLDHEAGQPAFSPEESPPESPQQIVQSLMALRDRRIGEELARLEQQYPTRRR